MGYTGGGFFHDREPSVGARRNEAHSSITLEHPLKQIFGSAVGGDGFSPLQETLLACDSR